jgi:hypothetical protein
MDGHTDLLQQLEARARQMESELATNHERLRDLQNDIRASQSALDALTQVIAYERGGRGDEAGGGSRVLHLQVQREEPLTQSRVIADAAYAVLEAEGPLHYRELTRRILDQGVAVGGSDPNAGVIGALVRDGRFYRPRRGVYYVRELAKGPVVNVGQRKNKGA